MSVEIPDKSYFKIGEVSRILGVEPYNIRYWESQFRIVKPAKTKSRQRLYRRRDIEILLRIKRLLYEEGYTIAGAKKRLKNLLDSNGASAPNDAVAPPDTLTNEERSAYDERLSTSQSELQALRAEASKLHEELDLLRAEHKAQLALYDADRSSLVERLDAVGEGATLDAERSALQSNVLELERQNAELDELLRAAQQAPAELAAVRARLTAQTERNMTNERELEQSQRQLRLLVEAIRSELTPLLGRSASGDEV